MTIVPRPTINLATPGDLDLPEGLEGFDRSDLKIPFVRIVQPISGAAEHAKPGQWHNSITGEAVDVLRFVIIRAAKGRALWGDDLSLKAPLCASDDAIHPRPGGQYAGPCASCPAAMWRGDTPPECSVTANILAVDRTNGLDLPFRMALMRTAYSPWKELFTRIHLARRPAWSFEVTATTAKVENQKGRYYVPRFELQPLPPEEQARYRELYLALRHVELTDVEEPAYEDGYGASVAEDVPF